MTGREDGGAAFPVPDERGQNGEGITQGERGMTLRDWFAGQAMAGMMAIDDGRVFNPAKDGSLDEWRVKLMAADAEHCYRVADALIAARKESQK